MLEDFDKQVSIWSESAVRAVNRRRFLHKAAKGAFATVAGLTLGTFVNIKDAFAITCTCDWACGVQCYGTGLYHASCPSGCVPCIPSDNCYNCPPGQQLCPYSDGSWVSCTGLGLGGGYKICRDCRCTSCSSACTILSDCICCSCYTPQQVEAEMRRLAATGIMASV